MRQQGHLSGAYDEAFTYDKNGNIKYLKRVGSTSPLMDDITYTYNTSGTDLLDNRLASVADIENLSGNDIAIGSHPYTYDEIGNLVSDVSEEIGQVNWTVSGKVSEIIRTQFSGQSNIRFMYDAMGNRVAKITGTEKNQEDWEYTYYIRDATGNVMAIYKKDYIDGAITGNLTERTVLSEQPIYGSSRLGNYNPNRLIHQSNIALNTTQAYNTDHTFNDHGITVLAVPAETINLYLRLMNKKNYELTNHLGNVLATVGDQKLGVDANTDEIAEGYKTKISSLQDYYAFGSLMPGRSYNSPDYRYGFNGAEKDDETKGTGNTLNFDARVYDPRIGRWLAVDMASKSAPQWTPYRFGFDNPLRYKDPSGMWEEDGHFWTVYAMGIAMGMKKSTARELAIKAEYYDHFVHNDNSMSIHPHKSGIAWGKDGGLGTWADPVLQKDWHGLTGGPQKEVLADAMLRVLLGDLNQLHKVGDAWAHSYIENGERVMYGQHGRNEPWYTPILRKFLGDITLEHAKAGPESGRHADNIAERPIEYSQYVNTLKDLFNSEKFQYNSEVSNSNPNLGIFSYVQKFGGNRDNNIFMFQSYIGIQSGQTSFTGLSGEQSNLLQGYLKQENMQYETNNDCGKTNIYVCPK